MKNKKETISVVNEGVGRVRMGAVESYGADRAVHNKEVGDLTMGDVIHKAGEKSPMGPGKKALLFALILAPILLGVYWYTTTHPGPFSTAIEKALGHFKP